MAISTLKDYFKKCQAQSGKGSFGIGWGNGAWAGWTAQNLFVRLQTNSGTPTNMVCDSDTSNAVLNMDRIPMVWSKKLWLAEMEWGAKLGDQGYQKNSAIVYDRLVAVGGLNAVTAGELTTNLPTPALTRYTDGEEVQIMLECYGTQSCPVGTLATVRYTNSKGVANRISQPVLFGVNNNYGNSGNTVMVPLADGDTGVLSVEGITLSQQSTSGTATNFGVTLVKLLAFGPIDSQAQIERQGYRNYLNGGGLMEIKPGTCIGLLLHGSSSATAPHYWMGRIGIISE